MWLSGGALAQHVQSLGSIPGPPWEERKYIETNQILTVVTPCDGVTVLFFFLFFS